VTTTGTPAPPADAVPRGVRPSLVWLLFAAVHAWLAYLGTGPESGSFADVELYRRWVETGLTTGTWPVLDGPWVYPVGALLAMLAPALADVASPTAYAAAWCLLVTVLDAVAVALMLRRGRSGRLGAAWWLVFLALLGPVAMGRIDAIVGPMSVVALLLALAHPRVSTVLVTAAAWIKVAPGAAILPVLLTARRPWRDVVLPGFVVCVVVVGTVAALGGADHVASFVQEQEQRGLQVESVAATPWLVANLFAPAAVIEFDATIVTYEIQGPGTQTTADVLGWLLPLAVLAVAALLWWRRRADGPVFWSDDARRGDLLLRTAFALAVALIVANKVGSPQFIAWLAPPVAVALCVGAPRWRRTAAVVLAVAAATQWVYPWQYDEVVNSVAGGTAVLTVRNALLVLLLVMTVRDLVRPADVSRPVGGEPREQVGPGAPVVDRGVR